MGIKTDNMIFVFGSNLAGVHGAGAALFAKNHRGAILGVGYGRTGQSYAIPTKDHRIQTMHYNEIYPFVEEFLIYTEKHPELHFQVTQIGCGLAGLRKENMAKMFSTIINLNDFESSNLWFDEAWLPFIGAGVWKAWGTM